MVVSSDKTKIRKTDSVKKILNLVQIYEENRKIVARSYDATNSQVILRKFGSPHRNYKNLSGILFSINKKDYNGKTLYVVYYDHLEVFNDIPIYRWTFYIHTVVEKLNATLEYIPISGLTKYTQATIERSRLEEEWKLDFFLNSEPAKTDLESYYKEDWCYVAPNPKPYSITETILILPMDKECWKWLGITIALSTLIWRISEGHWNFAFGAFSFFMGQAQLVIRIRT